jgi:hypothetical protein
MYEPFSGDDEHRKNRRLPSSRLRTPRASRATNYRHKPKGNGYGGMHRRRNKHWNW